MTTILDACLEATKEIWDDRDAYINAVLETLYIDPDYDYDDYLKEIP